MQSLQHKLDAARVQFGKFLRNWRRNNDWSVTTAQDWAKACPALIPWSLRVAGGQCEVVWLFWTGPIVNL